MQNIDSYGHEFLVTKNSMIIAFCFNFPQFSFFQPVKCHLCEKLLQSYELLKAHQTLPNHCGTCKEPFKTTCQLLQHKCEGEAKNLIISNTVSKKF